MTSGQARAAGAPMVRRANEMLVLGVLCDADSLTVSQLMELTGLSRASVHTVATSLIRQGWVKELQPSAPASASGLGRPSRTFGFDPSAGYVVGIDMGPTTIRVRVADLRGTVVAATSACGPKGRSAADVVRDAQQLKEQALHGVDDPARRILAITVALPAPVLDSGRVVRDNGQIPGLNGIDFVAEFGDLTYPVLVENDANLAVLAERWCGAASNAEHAVAILSGERLGSGIIENDRLVRGANGEAGELHVLRLVEGVGDTHGVGALARRLSGEALARYRAQPGNHAPGHTLNALAEKRDELALAEVIEAGRQGDAAARGILESVAEVMARTVAVIVDLLDPQVVVITGGAAHAGDALLEPVRHRLPALVRECPPIVASELAEEAVALGAIKMALDYIRPLMIP